MMYHLEQTLVDDFTQQLATWESDPWGQVQFTTEFFYLRGRTDVIALTLSGEILAFEAKLLKWRDALHQAYRNTCFAHFSYVLLPEEIAIKAARHENEFVRRSVGLCYTSSEETMILIEAPRLKPLQINLNKKAAAFIIERNDLDTANRTD